MKTVTQNFPVKNPPTKVGNYDYFYGPDSDPFNAYWNGSSFIIKDGSFADGHYPNMRKESTWRGLSERAK